MGGVCSSATTAYAHCRKQEDLAEVQINGLVGDETLGRRSLKEAILRKFYKDEATQIDHDKTSRASFDSSRASIASGSTTPTRPSNRWLPSPDSSFNRHQVDFGSMLGDGEWIQDPESSAPFQISSRRTPLDLGICFVPKALESVAESAAEQHL